MQKMTQAQAYKLIYNRASNMYNELKKQPLYWLNKADDAFADYLLGVMDITQSAPKDIKKALKYWEKRAKELDSTYVKAKYIGLVIVQKMLNMSENNCPAYNSWACREIDGNCADCEYSC